MLLKTIPLLGCDLSITDDAAATAEILHWAGQAEGRSVYAANVHMLMEAYDSPVFREILNQADLVTPDGMPLVWLMRRRGAPAQQRVYGPDLMRSVLPAAAAAGVPIGLYGAAPETLARLVQHLHAEYPELSIAYHFSPPFRALTASEDQQITAEMRASSARILFVGLGCPKQEVWIAAHRQELPCVLIGVGAAFDFFAGTQAQAPEWMQRAGFEWLFRLVHEPRRLWKRYLWHNPRFICLALAEQIRLSFGRRKS